MEARLLTLRDAAIYLSCSPKYLYTRTTKKGKDALPFKPIRRGGRVLFDRKQIDQWIDSLTQEDNHHGN